jgi:hypothetical protein
MPSGRLGMGFGLCEYALWTFPAVGDVVSQAAVVLRDQLSHGADEFLRGGQVPTSETTTYPYWSNRRWFA